MNCQYCDEPIFAKEIEPPMCQKHYEAALLVSRVTRQGKEMTLANALVIYARSLSPMAIEPEELPVYLADVVGQPVLPGEMPEPIDVFNAQGGFFWSTSPNKAGFRSSRGRRVFKAMFPDWETFVV